MWFPDTTTMNHFTNNFANLNLDATSYQGLDQVSISDGSTLPIHNIGLAHFPSSSRNFILKHLLHVPSITRNLIFVHQFCLDNSIFF